MLTNLVFCVNRDATQQGASVIKIALKNENYRGAPLCTPQKVQTCDSK